MQLSACLIARNEEQNLPRALRSLSNVVDEIIVTDTGSTDATPQIATEFGARVSTFEWCDDFSAARNFAIEQARGDWILWIDADEELLPESTAELKNCIEEEDALAYYIARRDLIDYDRPDHFTQMWQLRLFRRDERLRFRGRCHPEFAPPAQEIAAQEGMHVLTSSVTLRHYGYGHEQRKEKLRRAARLLALELEDRPDQLYYLIEYGRTIRNLDPPKGQQILKDVAAKLVPRLDDAEAPIPLVAALLEYLIQVPAEGLPPGLPHNAVVELAKRWFPQSAPLMWLRAQAAFGEERFREAERLLRKMVLMGKEKSYDQHISFDPAIVGDDAILNLGACLVRQAKLDEATACFKQLVNSQTRGQEARDNLEAINRLLKENKHKSRPKRKRSRKR
ncbi:MAG: glycosyl transferase [Phycisphaerae bacterium]|nr:MAG: glycosyl transferase [Phycisphaerae bacterium]